MITLIMMIIMILMIIVMLRQQSNMSVQVFDEGDGLPNLLGWAELGAPQFDREGGFEDTIL